MNRFAEAWLMVRVLSARHPVFSPRNRKMEKDILCSGCSIALILA